MKSDTRNKILETASELFYKKGYNITGVNEIIEAAGIAKATLYSHFSSKEDILLAYLDSKDAELLKNIKEFCNKKTKGNKRLIAVLQFLVPFFQQDNFNGCWCIRTLAEVPMQNQKVRLKIKNSKKNFFDFLEHLVLENKPELSAKEKKQLTNLLYLLYESAITESHIHNAEWPIEASISLLEDKLMKG